MGSNFQASRCEKAEVAKLPQGLYPMTAIPAAGHVPGSSIQKRSFSRNSRRGTIATLANDPPTTNNDFQF